MKPTRANAQQQVEKQPDEQSRTRDRILDAAENLFAQSGFHAMSLRTIASQAGVNLAAAHYHFGSKKGLIRGVLERRLAPIRTETIGLLEDCLADNPPDLARVLLAFLGPSLRMGGAPDALTFRKLAGRAAADPSPEVRELFLELTDQAAARFVEVVRRARPNLPNTSLGWPLACVFGTLFYVRANTGRLQRLPGLDVDLSDTERALKHLVPVLVAGFDAAQSDSSQ